MATVAKGTESFYQDTLVNYLVSMARTVEATVNRAMEALLDSHGPRAGMLVSEIFYNEPRINEMEIVSDEKAVQALRGAALPSATGVLRIFHGAVTQSSHSVSMLALR